jgi:hypothetical protein
MLTSLQRLPIRVLLLFIFIGLGACEPEVDPPRISYFSIETSSLLDTSESDDWIVVQDANSHVLGAKMFEAGETLEFDSTASVSGVLIVSIVKVIINPPQSYSVSTYVGVPLNDHWKLAMSASPAENVIGDVHVTLHGSNVGSWLDAYVSSKTFFAGSKFESSNPMAFHPVSITPNDNRLFVSASGTDRKPYFKIIDNVQPGELNLQFSDFSAFDKEVKAFCPASSFFTLASVRAYEVNGSGYTPSFRINNLTSGLIKQYDHLKLGYLQLFPKYLTSVYASYQGYSLYYYSFGSIPNADVSLLKPAISLVNKTPTDFSFQGSDFDWRNTFYRWSSTDPAKPSFSWNIYADKSSIKNPEMPSVLTQKYPALASVTYIHNSTSFYKGTSFNDFILKPRRGETTGDFEFQILTIN